MIRPPGVAFSVEIDPNGIAAMVRAGRFSTQRGHVFQGGDLVRARVIAAVMCDFRGNRAEILRRFAVDPAWLVAHFNAADAQFPGLVAVSAAGFVLLPAARPLTRMIARALDACDAGTARHSAAI